MNVREFTVLANYQSSLLKIPEETFFFISTKYLHVIYFHEIVTSTSPVVWGWGGKNDGEQDWICVAHSC